MNYEDRVTRLQGELDSLDAQALLVTNLTNVRYLTSFSGSNGQVLVSSDSARFMTDGRYRRGQRTWWDRPRCPSIRIG